MCKFAVVALLLLGLTVCGAVAHAQSGSGAASLRETPSARACGMGSAFVAVADDASSLWWNAGALGFTDLRNIEWTWGRLVPSISPEVQYHYFTGSFPVGKAKGLALGLPYLTYGTNVYTDHSGNVVGEFESYEIAPSFAFGGRLTDQVGLGGAVKFVRVDLAPAAVTRDGEAGVGRAIAFDVGLLVRFPEQRLNLGVSFQNLGRNVSFEDEDQSDPLPRNLKVGVAWWAVADPAFGLIVAADLNKPFVQWDDKPILNVGTEASVHWPHVTLSGRFGWVYEGWYQAIEPINGPSFGVGVRLWWVYVDLANMPQPEDLDRTGRLSLGVRF